MRAGLSRWLERQARTHGRGWRQVLAAIAWITVVAGGAQLLLAGTELRLLSADDAPAPAHYFRIVGMFMVLFGGAKAKQKKQMSKEKKKRVRWNLIGQN